MTNVHIWTIRNVSYLSFIKRITMHFICCRSFWRVLFSKESMGEDLQDWWSFWKRFFFVLHIFMIILSVQWKDQADTSRNSFLALISLGFIWKTFMISYSHKSFLKSDCKPLWTVYIRYSKGWMWPWHLYVKETEFLILIFTAWWLLERDTNLSSKPEGQACVDNEWMEVSFPQRIEICHTTLATLERLITTISSLVVCSNIIKGKTV